MSIKYELLKRMVVAAGLKKRWLSATMEELLENRMKQNVKNRIPALKDNAFNISRIDLMGFPVLKLIRKEPANKANLFLIGGGMISAPRPASIRKALRFARETGLDLFIPYYPLCTDYPLPKAYEMIYLIACEHCRNAFEEMEMLDEEFEKVLARRPEFPMPNWRELKAQMQGWDAIRKQYARGSMK